MEVSEQHNPYHYLSEDDFVYQNFIWLPLSDKSGLGKVSRVIWDWKGFEKGIKKINLENWIFVKKFNALRFIDVINSKKLKSED